MLNYSLQHLLILVILLCLLLNALFLFSSLAATPFHSWTRFLDDSLLVFLKGQDASTLLRPILQCKILYCQFWQISQSFMIWTLFLFSMLMMILNGLMPLLLLQCHFIYLFPLLLLTVISMTN